eukprot:8459028-Pyramimonas_sp.AAC.1
MYLLQIPRLSEDFATPPTSFVTPALFGLWPCHYLTTARPVIYINKSSSASVRPLCRGSLHRSVAVEAKHTTAPVRLPLPPTASPVPSVLAFPRVHRPRQER